MRHDNESDSDDAPDGSEALASAPIAAHKYPASLLGRALVAWTRVCLRASSTVVLVAVVSAVGAGFWTAQSLGYKVSRTDLLDPKSDYNKLWIDYVREFGEDEDAVVVVEGSSRASVIQVLEEVSQEVSRDGALFRSVLHEVDLSKIRAKGLHYLSPSELAEIDRFIQRTEPILDGGWAQLKVGTMVGGLAGQMVAGTPPGSTTTDELPAAALERYTESLVAGLDAVSAASTAKPGEYLSPWPGMPESLSTLRDLSSEHLLAKDGTLGFMLLRLAKAKGGFAGASVATDELRRLINLVAVRHPGVTIGLTGLPVMEDDEMRSSQQSMVWASGLSLAAVIVVIIAGFGGVRHALMANGVLIIGMAWAFAWATATVGHLNILSVTFTVTMIGVGIDYGTYYIGRYLELRRSGLPCETALLESSASVGPGILTGAITTAVAFFCAALTSFVGVAELGMIAGGGILLCAAAQLLVLPAVVAIVDRGPLGRRLPEPVPVHLWLQPRRSYWRNQIKACGMPSPSPTRRSNSSNARSNSRRLRASNAWMRLPRCYPSMSNSSGHSSKASAVGWRNFQSGRPRFPSTGSTLSAKRSRGRRAKPRNGRGRFVPHGIWNVPAMPCDAWAPTNAIRRWLRFSSGPRGIFLAGSTA
ncbi:MAG: MMPL family transporter [Planctomycetia bacterium]|nr:MMPL family transporter [Planctomycetia bacterium]